MASGTLRHRSVHASGRALTGGTGARQLVGTLDLAGGLEEPLQSDSALPYHGLAQEIVLEGRALIRQEKSHGDDLPQQGLGHLLTTLEQLVGRSGHHGPGSPAHPHEPGSGKPTCQLVCGEGLLPATRSRIQPEGPREPGEIGSRRMIGHAREVAPQLGRGIVAYHGEDGVVPHVERQADG